MEHSEPAAPNDPTTTMPASPALGSPLASAPATAPPSLQNVVHSVALVLMLGWILHLGSGVLVPMVLALMLSYVVMGVSRVIGAIPGLGRVLPHGLRHGFAACLIGIVLFEAALLFATNIAALAGRAPEFETQLLGMIQSGAETLGFSGYLSWETLRRDVLGQVDLQAMLRSGLSSTAVLLGGVIFVLLNVVFMLLEQRSFDVKLGAMSSDKTRVRQLRAVIADINARVGRYLAAKTAINILLGLVCYVILLIFGLEFAILWAIVTVFLNYIPYLGTWIAVALPMTLAVAQFGQLETVLMLLVVLSAAQFLIGNILEPQIMGSSLDLSPYAILISLTVWTSLWGVAGAIVSVPITAVLVIVLQEFSGGRPIAILLSRRGVLAPRSNAFRS